MSLHVHQVIKWLEWRVEELFWVFGARDQSNNELEGIRWYLTTQTCPESRTKTCGMVILPISTSIEPAGSLAPALGGLMVLLWHYEGLAEGNSTPGKSPSFLRSRGSISFRLWGPQEFVDMMIAQRRLDTKVGEHMLLKVLETTPRGYQKDLR